MPRVIKTSFLGNDAGRLARRVVTEISRCEANRRVGLDDQSKTSNSSSKRGDQTLS